MLVTYIDEVSETSFMSLLEKPISLTGFCFYCNRVFGNGYTLCLGFEIHLRQSRRKIISKCNILHPKKSCKFHSFCSYPMFSANCRHFLVSWWAFKVCRKIAETLFYVSQELDPHFHGTILLFTEETLKLTLNFAASCCRTFFAAWS